MSVSSVELLLYFYLFIAFELCFAIKKYSKNSDINIFMAIALAAIWPYLVIELFGFSICRCLLERQK